MRRGVLLPVNPTRDRKLVSKHSNTPAVYATYRAVGHTCPPSCSMLIAMRDKGANHPSCYASRGRVALHQRNRYADDDGARLREWMLNLPANAIVRHHVSGDVMLPGNATGSAIVDWPYWHAILDAHRERVDVTGWLYTHGWRELGRLDQYSVPSNLTVNASVDNTSDVELARGLGYAITRVVTRDAPRRSGNAVVCPEQTAGVPCVNCRLCLRSDRPFDVLFRAH